MAQLLSVALADQKLWSDFALAVDIIHVKGASFINATTAVEADAKQSAIAVSQ